MRTKDITIKGSVSVDRQQDLICLFGKLEWHINYHPYKQLCPNPSKPLQLPPKS